MGKIKKLIFLELVFILAIGIILNFYRLEFSILNNLFHFKEDILILIPLIYFSYKSGKKYTNELLLIPLYIMGIMQSDVIVHFSILILMLILFFQDKSSWMFFLFSTHYILKVKNIDIDVLFLKIAEINHYVVFLFQLLILMLYKVKSIVPFFIIIISKIFLPSILNEEIYLYSSLLMFVNFLLLKDKYFLDIGRAIIIVSIVNTNLIGIELLAAYLFMRNFTKKELETEIIISLILLIFNYNLISIIYAITSILIIFNQENIKKIDINKIMQNSCLLIFLIISLFIKNDLLIYNWPYKLLLVTGIALLYRFFPMEIKNFNELLIMKFKPLKNNNIYFNKINKIESSVIKIPVFRFNIIDEVPFFVGLVIFIMVYLYV